MNSGFITQMKDKNGDSWYHQIVVETQQQEIERLNNIIKELKAILKSKGYETYIPALERSDKE